MPEVITLSDSESDSDLPEVVLVTGGGWRNSQPATAEVESEEEAEVQSVVSDFVQIVSDSEEEPEVETQEDESDAVSGTEAKETDVLTVVEPDSDEEEESNQIQQYIGAEDVLTVKPKRRRVIEDTDSESESPDNTELWDSKTAIFIGTF